MIVENIKRNVQYPSAFLKGSETSWLIHIRCPAATAVINVNSVQRNHVFCGTRQRGSVMVVDLLSRQVFITRR